LHERRQPGVEPVDVEGDDADVRRRQLRDEGMADFTASARADAGRDGAEAEKPEPTGQLGTDEPLPEWERDLYESSEKKDAEAPAAASAAVETPAEQPLTEPVETSVSIPVASVPAE